MIQYLREVRLVPVVLFATISLFALKTIGLVLDGHYTLDDTADLTGTIPGAANGMSNSGRPGGKPPGTQSWAQQMFNFPDTTGAAGDPKPEPKPPAKNDRGRPEELKEVKEPPKDPPKEPPKDPKDPKGTAGWKPVPLDGTRPQSAAELAILERLQDRRAELDARAKDLDMRENLLKAAEKRVEARINELKDLEARINTTLQQRDDGDAARFKNVVTMYENMKAKEAAKIFDRLDLKILVEVAKEINPRRMSDILAQMQPDSAQQLTVELAARSKDKDKPAELPKIEGKPTPTN
ncbi:MAG TPA: flagellar protein FlbB [Xanthobacteraceae bacterium]|nr:flagellar protein FlbB [Xanthobacteraceae bacterium]